MNDCLVTKLAARVDNENLPFLDSVVLPILSGGTCRIAIKGNGKSINSSVPFYLNDQYAGESYTSYTINSPNETSFFFPSYESAYNVKVSKYSESLMFNGGAGFVLTEDIINQLAEDKFLFANTKVDNSVEVNIDGVKALRSIRIISRGKILGNLSAFIAKCTNLELFEVSSVTIPQTPVAAFANKTLLTSLKLSDTNFTGTLESVIEGMLAAGRNSGTMTFTSSNVSFNNIKKSYSTEYTISFGSNTATVVVEGGGGTYSNGSWSYNS